MTYWWNDPRVALDYLKNSTFVVRRELKRMAIRQLALDPTVYPGAREDAAAILKGFARERTIARLAHLERKRRRQRSGK